MATSASSLYKRAREAAPAAATTAAKTMSPDALRKSLTIRGVLAALGFGAGTLGLGMVARGAKEYGDILSGWDQPPTEQPQGTTGLMGVSRKERKRPPLGYTPTPVSVALPALRKRAAINPVSWWEYPALTGAGAVGLTGGWKLVDRAIQKRRKRLEAQQLQDARDEYSAALRDQYRGLLQKQGVLDEVFEKVGGQLTQALIGTGAIALGMGGIAGGISGWRLADARSYKARLARALELRKRMLAQQPPPLYATPETMAASPLAVDDEEDDEE